MTQLIYSEYIKGKHTPVRKLLFLLPLLVSLMAAFLMRGQLTQIGAYNWWYMMLLPTIVALFCAQLIQSEKKIGYFNLEILPYSRKLLWQAKISIACLYLLTSSLVLFGLTTIFGFIFGAQLSISQGLLACIILTITWIWQIPLALFLSAKFNSTTTFISIIGLNLILSIQDFSGGPLWFIPFSITPRLMAAIIAVNPNGVPLSSTSDLHNTTVVLPGILITICLFILLSWLTTKWFNNRRN